MQPVHDAAGSSAIAREFNRPVDSCNRLPIDLVRYFDEIGLCLSRAWSVEGARCWRLAPKARSDLRWTYTSITELLAEWHHRMRRTFSELALVDRVLSWLPQAETGALDALECWFVAIIHGRTGRMSPAPEDGSLPTWLIDAARTADVWSAGTMEEKGARPFPLERGAMRRMQGMYLRKYGPTGYAHTYGFSLQVLIGVRAEARARLERLPDAGVCSKTKRL